MKQVLLSVDHDLFNRRVRAHCARIGVQIHDKSKAWHQWAIYYVALMWIWKPGYMTRVTTVFGRHIYASPERQADSSFWRTLLHELIHVHDQKAIGEVRYTVGYGGALWGLLAPLGLVGTIWTPWAWFAALGLVCAAPWPAPGRARVELRGFRMTFAAYSLGRPLRSSDKDWFRELFLGWPYYRMVWSERWITVEWDRIRTDVATGAIWKDPAFKKLLGVLRGSEEEEKADG